MCQRRHQLHFLKKAASSLSCEDPELADILTQGMSKRKKLTVHLGSKLTEVLVQTFNFKSVCSKPEFDGLRNKYCNTERLREIVQTDDTFIDLSSQARRVISPGC